MAGTPTLPIISLLNRLDEAEQAIHRAIELQPLAEFHYSTLAGIEVQRGDAQAALAAAQQERPCAGVRSLRQVL